MKRYRVISSLILAFILTIIISGCSGKGELTQLTQEEAEKIYELEKSLFFMYVGSHEDEIKDLKPVIEKVTENTKKDIQYFVYDDINAVGYDDVHVDYDEMDDGTPISDLDEDYIYYIENGKVIDKIDLRDYYIYDQEKLHPELTDFLERY